MIHGENSEFYRSLIIPLPLDLVEKKLTNQRDVNKRVVRDLIDDYVKKNTESYKALAGLMLELMNSEVSFQEPNQEKIEGFKKKLEGLDERFKYVDQFMKDLNRKERNDLTKNFLDESASKLRSMRGKILDVVKYKESWNTNDVLMPSYYDRYIEFLGLLTFALTKKKGINPRVKGALNFLSLAYQVVIYAYFENELMPAVMVRRYSELGIITSSLSKRKSKTRKQVVSALKELPPPENRDVVVSS